MVHQGKQKLVTNRIGLGDYLESDLVYPLDKGYRYVCQVTENWIMSKTWGQRIANKYAIEIDGKLYVNHDDNYFLIEKEEN